MICVKNMTMLPELTVVLVRGAFSIYQIHPLTPSPAPGLAHYLPTIHASQRPGRVLY